MLSYSSLNNDTLSVSHFNPNLSGEAGRIKRGNFTTYRQKEKNKVKS